MQRVVTKKFGGNAKKVTNGKRLLIVEIKERVVLIVQVATGFAITVLSYELVYKSEEYRDVRNEALKMLHIKK